jgi:branched-chain amino acid transport system permease protein
MLGHPLNYWLGLIVNGLATGGTNALFAAGLTIIFGVVGILNFAQGEFFMLAGYLAYWYSATLGLGFWLGVVLTTVSMYGLGAMSYYGLFRRLQKSSRTLEVGLVTTLGLSLVLQNGALAVFGAESKAPNNELIAKSVDIGGVDTGVLQLITLGLAIVALGGLALAMRYTRIGLAMRAVPQNRDFAQVLGIPSSKITRTSIAVGMALTGLAAAAIVPFYGAFPTMGVGFVYTGFAIVVIAGLGSLSGSVAVALVIGIVMSIAGGIFSAQLEDAAPLVLMSVLLVWRPDGLSTSAVRTA